MNEVKKIISNSSIVFVGTFVGSIFSYLFNMLTGRMLGPSLYGEFTAIMSVMMILSVAGGAILTVTMKYSSELFAKKEFGALEKLFKKFSSYVFQFALFLFVICVLFLKPISAFFSISEITPIVIAFLSFIFGFLIMVNKGILQGTQKFLPLSAAGALEMGLRLFLGVVLIKLGLSLSGAMAAVVLSTAIVYIITLFPVRNIFLRQTKQKEEFKFNKKGIANYTIPALVAAILLTAALNIDIILVKHYFNPETAGIYAAISTIGKIVLYATGPIVGVMFPMVLEKKATGEKHYKLFLFSILLTVIGGLVILGIYAVAPGTVIKLLYGAKYVAYYELLPKVGLFILLYALINILANYFLAIKNFVFLYIFSVILILQVVLIGFEHSSLEMVVKILTATSGLLFALLFGYYLVTKKEQLLTFLKGENAEPS